MRILHNMEKILKKVYQLSKNNIHVDNHFQKKQLFYIRNVLEKKKEHTKTNLAYKVNEARLWLEEFTGLDKVHAAQSDVMYYQNEFIKSQTKRRELGTKLLQLQIELNDLHNEIVVCNRTEEKYLRLITEEHQLAKKEIRLRNEFVMAEAEERENFTLFTTKIKETQDKEKEQALRTKYWTVVISCVITGIGLGGNSVISFLKSHKLNNKITSLGEKTQNLTSTVDEKVSVLAESQRSIVHGLNELRDTMESTFAKRKENAISGHNYFGLGYIFSGVTYVGSGVLNIVKYVGSSTYSVAAWTGNGLKYIFLGSDK